MDKHAFSDTLSEHIINATEYARACNKNIPNALNHAKDFLYDHYDQDTFAPDNILYKSYLAIHHTDTWNEQLYLAAILCDIPQKDILLDFSELPHKTYQSIANYTPDTTLDTKPSSAITRQLYLINHIKSLKVHSKYLLCNPDDNILSVFEKNKETIIKTQDFFTGDDNKLDAAFETMLSMTKAPAIAANMLLIQIKNKKQSPIQPS